MEEKQKTFTILFSKYCKISIEIYRIFHLNNEIIDKVLCFDKNTHAHHNRGNNLYHNNLFDLRLCF